MYYQTDLESKEFFDTRLHHKHYVRFFPPGIHCWSDLFFSIRLLVGKENERYTQETKTRKLIGQNTM